HARRRAGREPVTPPPGRRRRPRSWSPASGRRRPAAGAGALGIAPLASRARPSIYRPTRRADCDVTSRSRRVSSLRDEKRKETRVMTAETYPIAAATPRTEDASSLSSRRGVAILVLLCLVQFMDILDASILNIALPSIKRDLGFSQEGLQWVVNGYILTYGGFLLLGGRVADLLGRRRILVTGLVVFAGASLVGGLSHSESLLIGARFAQGMGAAMLSPAALSSLTTIFRSGRERNTALGAWAAVSGLGGA